MNNVTACRPIAFDLIRQVVLNRLNVPVEDFESKKRAPAFVLARRLVVRICRLHTRLSYPEIARLMGRPNHSSVITTDSFTEKALESESFGAPSVHTYNEASCEQCKSLSEIIEGLWVEILLAQLENKGEQIS